MSSSNEHPQSVDSESSESSPSRADTAMIEMEISDEAAVEVIHWIPASAGAVIQVPNSKTTHSFTVQLNEEGQAVEVAIYPDKVRLFSLTNILTLTHSLLRKSLKI